MKETWWRWHLDKLKIKRNGSGSRGQCSRCEGKLDSCHATGSCREDEARALEIKVLGVEVSHEE